MNSRRTSILRMVGALLATVALTIVVVYAVTETRFRRTWPITPAALDVPTDSAAIARGSHIATIRACTGCHGDDLGGRAFYDEPLMGRLYAANLTAGTGGVGALYRTADWIRAIRHGIKRDGRSLLYMPSQDYAELGDRDLGDLIAWIRSVPPVSGGAPFTNRVGLLGRALYLTGQLPLLPAELVEHRTGPITSPLPGPTVEYGGYISTGCRGCHGEDYAGGPVPGNPRSALPAANLTPAASGLAEWSEADVFRAIRTGVRPDGSAIDPVQMPWPSLSVFTDDEVRAMWRFLRSLPPVTASFERRARAGGS